MLDLIHGNLVAMNIYEFVFDVSTTFQFLHLCMDFINYEPFWESYLVIVMEMRPMRNRIWKPISWLPILWLVFLGRDPTGKNHTLLTPTIFRKTFYFPRLKKRFSMKEEKTYVAWYDGGFKIINQWKRKPMPKPEQENRYDLHIIAYPFRDMA
jgi:hypothetical protein